MSTVTERCACGASLSLPDNIHTSSRLTRFRAEHLHEMPPEAIRNGAVSAADDLQVPAPVCEHDWIKCGDEDDPWVECWLCGEICDGWTLLDDQSRVTDSGEAARGDE